VESLYKKPIVRRDPETGEKATKKSKKWWGRYTDVLGREKRVPLATDLAPAVLGLPRQSNRPVRRILDV